MNSILQAIEQVGSERILKFTFESKEAGFILYAELFAKGNMILCNEKGIVISLMQKQKWKDRTVAVSRKYEHPKKGFNIFSLRREELDRLKESRADSAVKALAIDLGLGGAYAEEACIIANIDKNMAPKRFTDIDLNAIFKAVVEITGKKPEPRAVIKEGKVVNVVPFDLEFYESCEFERYDSYNKALDDILSKEMSDAEEEWHFFEKQCSNDMGCCDGGRQRGV